MALAPILAGPPRPDAPPYGLTRGGIVVVEMTSRAGGPRFEPAEPVARVGDTVRFRNVRGGPHNVQFFADSLEAVARATLGAAMTGQIGGLAGPLLFDRDDRYDLVVPALPPGRYPFVCAPHYGGGMRGALVIVPEPAE